VRPDWTDPEATGPRQKAYGPNLPRATAAARASSTGFSTPRRACTTIAPAVERHGSIDLLDLLGLPVGTLPRVGDFAVLEVTGLRNPCLRIDDFRNGLLKQVVGRDEAGNIVRKAGITGIVRQGGVVRPGDTIEAERR
jgi:hypothetical protein